MTISSRTPEGLPFRCPVCAFEFRLEASSGSRDVTCPRCGHLVWLLDILSRYIASREMHGGEATDNPARLLEEDLDSLELVEFIMWLEDENDFDIKINEADYGQIRSISDVLRLIEDQLPDK